MTAQSVVGGRPLAEGHAPLILYSPVSWLLALRMLMTDEALDPTVSTRSNPGADCCWGSRLSPLVALGPRRAKRLRMGMAAATSSRVRREDG